MFGANIQACLLTLNIYLNKYLSIGNKDAIFSGEDAPTINKFSDEESLPVG